VSIPTPGAEGTALPGAPPARDVNLPSKLSGSRAASFSTASAKRMDGL